MGVLHVPPVAVAVQSAFAPGWTDRVSSRTRQSRAHAHRGSASTIDSAETRGRCEGARVGADSNRNSGQYRWALRFTSGQCRTADNDMTRSETGLSRKTDRYTSESVISGIGAWNLPSPFTSWWKQPSAASETSASNLWMSSISVATPRNQEMSRAPLTTSNIPSPLGLKGFSCPF